MVLIDDFQFCFMFHVPCCETVKQNSFCETSRETKLETCFQESFVSKGFIEVFVKQKLKQS